MAHRFLINQFLQNERVNIYIYIYRIYIYIYISPAILVFVFAADKVAVANGFSPCLLINLLKQGERAKVTALTLM